MNSSRTPGRSLLPIFGPPGTGKTTTLLSILDRELNEYGTAPSRIAFASFTRAARQEVFDRAAARFGLTSSDLPWVRTIHSTGFRLLGLSKDRVFSSKHWREFCQRYAYDMTPEDQSEDDPFVPPQRTDDDTLRAAFEWARNRRVTLEVGLRTFPGQVRPDLVHLFVQRYTAFKQARGLADFTDMVEQALDMTLDVDVAFVDEAQDLSPLQIEAVCRWYAHCERVYVAGDDDQAIYSFQGADPTWLLHLAANANQPPLKLAQSYRIPARVHAVAQSIIGDNLARVPKPYRPRDEAGDVLILPPNEALNVAATDAATGSVFVLARNWRTLGPFRDALEAMGEPFLVERGFNPLGWPALRQAVAAAQDLVAGRSVHVADLGALLAFYPSRGLPSGLPALPHGIKAALERSDGRVTLAELASRWKLAPWLAYLKQHGPTAGLLKDPKSAKVPRVTQQLRGYLSLVLERFGELPKSPRITLTSIHQSKGREADTVVVISDLARATYRDMLGGDAGREAENRAAYVAVTRARRRLVVALPSTPMAYPYERYVAMGVG